MTKLQIITNRHWHYFLYGYELTKKERDEFDYLSDDEINEHSFLRYRGQVYILSDFERTPSNTVAYRYWSRMQCEHPEWSDWQAYQSDSFFSGIVIRLSDDGEQYQIGTYLS